MGVALVSGWPAHSFWAPRPVWRLPALAYHQVAPRLRLHPCWYDPQAPRLPVCSHSHPNTTCLLCLPLLKSHTPRASPKPSPPPTGAPAHPPAHPTHARCHTNSTACLSQEPKWCYKNPDAAKKLCLVDLTEAIGGHCQRFLS